MILYREKCRRSLEEKRIDPEDGMAYTWDELLALQQHASESLSLKAYYKGKYKKKELEAIPSKGGR